MQTSSGTVEIDFFLSLGGFKFLVELFRVEFVGVGLDGLSWA
jgi:hypothetical protein